MKEAGGPSVGGGGGGEGAFDTTQELNLYYSRTITSTVFLLRGFSSNLSGTEFGVVRFW